MRRFGRKLDVERLREELPITPFFFDALYLDGDPLVDEPLDAPRCRSRGSGFRAGQPRSARLSRRARTMRLPSRGGRLPLVTKA